MTTITISALCISFLILMVIAHSLTEYLKAKREAAEAEKQKYQTEEDALLLKTLREVCYDGCAYAFEQEGKAVKAGQVLAGSEKKRIATDFVLRTLQWAERDMVQDVIESCLAKVSGAGASGVSKI